MKIEVKFEETGNGFSAYVLDLPGCVAAAETLEATQELIREAITMHLEALMLRKDIVSIVAVEFCSQGARLWTTDNSPTLFVDIEVPALSIASVVTPAIQFGQGQVVGAAS